MKRLLCSEGGELGDNRRDRDEEGEADEMLVRSATLRRRSADMDEARKASDVGGQGHHGPVDVLIGFVGHKPDDSPDSSLRWAVFQLLLQLLFCLDGLEGLGGSAGS